MVVGHGRADLWWLGKDVLIYGCADDLWWLDGWLICADLSIVVGQGCGHADLWWLGMAV